MIEDIQKYVRKGMINMRICDEFRDNLISKCDDDREIIGRLHSLMSRMHKELMVFWGISEKNKKDSKEIADRFINIYNTYELCQSSLEAYYVKRGEVEFRDSLKTENNHTLLDAERSVLGAMLLHQKCYSYLFDNLCSADFITHENKLLFLCLVDLKGEGLSFDLDLILEWVVYDKEETQKWTAESLWKIISDINLIEDAHINLKRLKNNSLNNL